MDRMLNVPEHTVSGHTVLVVRHRLPLSRGLTDRQVTVLTAASALMPVCQRIGWDVWSILGRNETLAQVSQTRDKRQSAAGQSQRRRPRLGTGHRAASCAAAPPAVTAENPPHLTANGGLTSLSG